MSSFGKSENSQMLTRKMSIIKKFVSFQNEYMDKIMRIAFIFIRLEKFDFWMDVNFWKTGMNKNRIPDLKKVCSIFNQILRPIT